MGIIGKAALAVTLAILTATGAAGQTSKTLHVVFTGVVANDVTDSIMIRQPDGTPVPYTGPKPDYPYHKGDTVRIAFDTTVPTKAFYGDSYTGQRAADGIYRFSVTGVYQQPAGSFGVAGAPEIDGGFALRPEDRPNPYVTTGMTIVYDVNKDGYSLELPNGQWTGGQIDGPSFDYDRATNTLVPRDAICVTADCTSTGLKMVGTKDNVSFGRDLAGSDGIAWPIGDTRTPLSSGFFDFLLNGSWNLPFFGDDAGGGSGGGGSAGDPAAVPEPASMALFGVGAGALAWRRRRRSVS